MLRRLGPRRDGGAGLAEYAGLVVLAALILGALVAIGIPSKVETGVSSAICRIFQGQDCGKPEASGKNPGNQNPGDQKTGGQNNGGQNNGNQNGSQNESGQNGDDGDDTGQAAADEQDPTLGDLQKQADKAQNDANAAGSGDNIKQQIIDLLKDFIGITDVEDCITKGSISACLWAAFDVGSLFFAALKIAKFAKAIKEAVKLYKDFNRIRKTAERLKNNAKRLKDLLKRRRLACGLPAAWSILPNAPPTRFVPASLAVPAAAPVRGAVHGETHAAVPVLLPAAPGPTCGLSPQQIANELAKAKKTGRAGLRAQESLGGHTIDRHVAKSRDYLLKRLRDKPSMKVASTYNSFNSADKAVGRVLADKAADIKKWLPTVGEGKTTTFDMNIGKKVGTCVLRGGQTKVAKSVRVVIKKDKNSPDGYRVLTSFPIPE